jgi:HAD superfamily hydrolase (TIGR01450 family)
VVENRAESPALIVCDLDGVIWLSGVPIPGSVEAVGRLRDAGCRVVFVTNNSNPTIVEHTAKLTAIGVVADGDVISSATAAGELLRPGERVLVCGGAGIGEAAAAVGASPFEGDDEDAVAEGIDVVVAGFHRSFDYERLRLATTAIRSGARFVATNRDPLYPSPGGPIPGGGSIVAAIAAATGVEPETAGKPYPPMVRAVLRLLGGDGDDLRRRIVVVGDQPSTDGRLAAALGSRFAIVRTGYSMPGAVLDPPPDFDAADLAAVADAVLAVRSANAGD